MSTAEGDGFTDGMQTAASTLTIPLNAGKVYTAFKVRELNEMFHEYPLH